MPLVFVPTPLGNLRDITLRAIDTLRESDLIVAEDTRVAHRLLTALGIAGKPIWSYREANAAAVTPGILERARDATVAVVSDAGMPAISDPGRDLVRAARAAGIAIEALPGPSAFVCAAVLSGFDLERFSFEGFVPRRSAERERALRAAYDGAATSLWYDSPRRIRATLATLAAIDPDMPIFIARELTKLHEQQIAGTPGRALAELPELPLGEFVLAIAGRPGTERGAPAEAVPEDLDDEITRALARGESAPAIARALARRGFGSRSELYARISSRRTERNA